MAPQSRTRRTTVINACNNGSQHVSHRPHVHPVRATARRNNKLDMLPCKPNGAQSGCIGNVENAIEWLDKSLAISSAHNADRLNREKQAKTELLPGSVICRFLALMMLMLALKKRSKCNTTRRSLVTAHVHGETRQEADLVGWIALEAGW